MGIAAFLDLSVYNPPPGDHLMAVLKAYADDSWGGDQIVSIAAYVSDADGWRAFEQDWRAALSRAGAPYFHMKEFWSPSGPFTHLHDDPAATAQFLSELVRTIRAHLKYCATPTVRIEDLEGFNRSKGVSLEPYPLALYACFIELRHAFPNDEIELVVDKIEHAHAKIAVAEAYAESDTFADLRPDDFITVPLKKTESFKSVLPIQAADFMAWELRKSCMERLSWEPAEVDRILGGGRLRQSYEAWGADFEAREGRAPRDRKSAWALMDATPQGGQLWDFHLILAADVNRHPNGWGV